LLETPLEWSDALSTAALEYINQLGITGDTEEASIFMTARNKYAATVCNNYEFVL